MKTLLLLLAVAAVLTGVPSPAAPPAPADSSLATVRATVAQWVEAEQTSSREQADWQYARELLQARLTLVRSEIAALQEKLQQNATAAGDAEKKQSDLLTQQEEIKTATSALAEEIGTLETGIRRLYRSIPAPWQPKLDPLCQRMPTDPAQTRISLAERFQNVLGLLNEINKLNAEVTVATELRSLADGKPTEVKTVYLGLAQAYYVSARGEAGVGHAAADGWHWEAANDLAAPITEVIQILNNKARPRFVPLPVKIQ